MPIALSACVPAITHYYDAKSEYGEPIPAPGCKPDKSWLFYFDGDVSLELFPWDTAIGLTFKVPEQFTVQMESNEVRLWTGNEEEPQHLLIEQLEQLKSVTDRAMVNWDSALIGGTTALMLGLKTNMIYTVTLDPSPGLSGGDLYRVAVPPFQVNGQRYELPIVRFSRSTRFWIFPINC